jgi:thioredoxin-related protein
MKKMTMGLLLCWMAMQGMAAEKVEWLTDLPAAQAKAKKENKLVIMDFTGSDWCVWCKKLHEEVFSKQEFEDYAAKNLVPVLVDFPQDKPQTKELKAANKALQEKYKIDGFPTVVVLNGEGKEIGKLNYEKGGPKVFIESLEKLKK